MEACNSQPNRDDLRRKARLRGEFGVSINRKTIGNVNLSTTKRALHLKTNILADRKSKAVTLKNVPVRNFP